VVQLVSKVFDVPLVGVCKLLHVMLVILGGSMMSAGRTLQKIQSLEKEMTGRDGLNYSSYETIKLNKRWRAERNLWLSAFAFTMWTVLAIFYREMARRLRVEDRLAEFEMSDFTGTIDTTREVSLSKEVTSRPQTGVLSPIPKSPQPSPLKMRAHDGDSLHVEETTQPDNAMTKKDQ